MESFALADNWHWNIGSEHAKLKSGSAELLVVEAHVTGVKIIWLMVSEHCHT